MGGSFIRKKAAGVKIETSSACTRTTDDGRCWAAGSLKDQQAMRVIVVAILMCKATAFFSGSLIIRGVELPRTNFVVEESRRTFGLAASPAEQVGTRVHMWREHGAERYLRLTRERKRLLRTSSLCGTRIAAHASYASSAPAVIKTF